MVWLAAGVVWAVETETPESIELPPAAVPVPVPLVACEDEARLCELAVVVRTLLDDLRFEPTKFRKRWFIGDMDACAVFCAGEQEVAVGRLC